LTICVSVFSDDELNIVQRLTYKEASKWLPPKLYSTPPVLQRQGLSEYTLLHCSYGNSCQILSS